MLLSQDIKDKDKKITNDINLKWEQQIQCMSVSICLNDLAPETISSINYTMTDFNIIHTTGEIGACIIRSFTGRKQVERRII